MPAALPEQLQPWPVPCLSLASAPRAWRSASSPRSSRRCCRRRPRNRTARYLRTAVSIRLEAVIANQRTDAGWLALDRIERVDARGLHIELQASVLVEQVERLLRRCVPVTVNGAGDAADTAKFGLQRARQIDSGVVQAFQPVTTAPQVASSSRSPPFPQPHAPVQRQRPSPVRSAWPSRRQGGLSPARRAAPSPQRRPSPVRSAWLSRRRCELPRPPLRRPQPWLARLACAPSAASRAFSCSADRAFSAAAARASSAAIFFNCPFARSA